MRCDYRSIRGDLLSNELKMLNPEASKNNFVRTALEFLQHNFAKPATSEQRLIAEYP